MRDRYGPLVTGVSSKFITRVGKYVAQPGLVVAILSHRVSASAACQRVAAGLATGEFAVVFVDRWRVPALIPVQVWLRVPTAECEKGSAPDHTSAPSQAAGRWCGGAVEPGADLCPLAVRGAEQSEPVPRSARKRPPLISRAQSSVSCIAGWGYREGPRCRTAFRQLIPGA